MEITLIGQGSIKLKGKRSTILVDPIDSKAGTTAEVVLLLDKTIQFDSKKISENRITIQGPGEYEVSGTAISGYGQTDSCIYSVTVDGVSILVGKISNVEKLQDKLKECRVAVLNVDHVPNPSLIPALDCTMVVFYGTNALDAVKSTGKTIEGKTQKVTVTLDKLPQEMEVIALE